MRFVSHQEFTHPTYPMVVLVNHGSAGSSEIVAGALQAHSRAVILGTSTFGMGTVQSVIPLSDKSGLRLTTARYFTPAGQAIQDKGIIPNIVIEPSQSQEAITLGDIETDIQLQRAIDILKAITFLEQALI